MELLKLNDYFKDKKYKFNKHDYLYLHKNDNYPKKNEMDFLNFFFVIELFEDKVKVLGLTSRVEKEIEFSDFNDNWWFFRIS